MSLTDFPKVWDQTVYFKSVWNPDAELGSQTLVSKMGCDKYHVIKLKVVWTRKKESQFWLENVRGVFREKIVRDLKKQVEFNRVDNSGNSNWMNKDIGHKVCSLYQRTLSPCLSEMAVKITH